MSGLGGLNKTPDGVVIGLVQLQLPTIAAKSDLAAQTQKICAMVQKARKGMPTMDLVVFPEYSLHGLSMDTTAELMSRLDRHPRMHLAVIELDLGIPVCEGPNG